MYLLHANQESTEWRGPGLEKQVHPFIHVCRLCLLCWCSGFAELCAVGGRTISDKSRSPKQRGITSCQQKPCNCYNIKSGRGLGKEVSVGPNQFLELRSMHALSDVLEHLENAVWKLLKLPWFHPLILAEHSSFYKIEPDHMACFSYAACMHTHIHTFVHTHTHELTELSIIIQDHWFGRIIL